jgi:two-component system, chemotaxis family, chemotaxis protein CheY
MSPSELDVLIVDDQEAMRTLLTRVLQKAAAVRVRAAANGADGISLLSQSPATLVLVDQNMPGMAGLAFIAAVRGDPALGSPRIIMISGHAGLEQAKAARAAGADAVLVKPVAPSELLGAINALFAV